MKQLTLIFLTLLSISLSAQGQTWKSYYQQVKELSAEQYLVQRFDKYGMVNQEGQVIIPVEYDSLFAYSKGFIALSNKNINYSKGDVYSAKGLLLFKENDSLTLSPLNDPRWQIKNGDVPLIQLRAGLIADHSFQERIPFIHKDLFPLGYGSSLYLAQNDAKQIALIDSNNRQISPFQYRRDEKESEFIESIYKSHQKQLNNNWLYRGEELVYISISSGKELWSSKENPREILACGDGLTLVKSSPSAYSKPQEYWLIDEATQSAKKMDNSRLNEIMCYLGNGQFYVALNDGEHGIMNLAGKLESTQGYHYIERLEKGVQVNEMSEKELQFEGYYKVKNDDGNYLWNPQTNHRIKISEQNFRVSTLKPFSKSGRYWVLAEFDKELKSGIINSDLGIKQLIICDSISQGIVFELSGYPKWNLRGLESNGEKGIWLFKKKEDEFYEDYIIWANGKARNFYKATIEKVSDDAQYLLIRSEDNAILYDAINDKTLQTGLADVVHFGADKGRFLLLKEDNKRKVFLCDTEGKIIKTIPIKGLYGINKEPIKSSGNQKTFLANVMCRDDLGSQYDYRQGLLDADGNFVLDAKYPSIDYVYADSGKYAFGIGPKSFSSSSTGKIIPMQGPEMTYMSGSYRYWKEYLIVYIDEDHQKVINLKTGQQSIAFDKNDYLGFLVVEGQPILRQVKAGKESLYNLKNFSLYPLSEEPVPYANRSAYLDLEGQKKIDWHAFRRYFEGFFMVYRYVEKSLPWD